MLTRKRLCATAFQFRCQRTVDLHVSPDFSGRVLVYLQTGWSLNVALLTPR
jgi:hypothetical protein